ncbi:Neprilysin-4 [Actinomortierella ambigua]|nr:Neprilysin-4 [Actinomortierella ambigua]
MMTASFAPPSPSGQAGPANATVIDFDTMAQEIVAFETALAKIATDPQELHDSSRNIHPRNLGQLDRLNPAVDWSLFLEQTLQTRALHRQNITVRSPAYVEQLGRLLQQTQPSTLQHCLAWKLIFRRGQDLSSEFRRPLEMFQATLSGANP